VFERAIPKPSVAQCSDFLLPGSVMKHFFCNFLQKLKSACFGTSLTDSNKVLGSQRCITAFLQPLFAVRGFIIGLDLRTGEDLSSCRFEELPQIVATHILWICQKTSLHTCSKRQRRQEVSAIS